MRRVLALTMAIVIIFSVGFMGSGAVTAHSGPAPRDVSVGSYDGDTLIRGACLELAPYSNVGCDVNGDGYVWFEDIPSGTYTVIYDFVPAGFLRPMPREIVVNAGAGTTLTIDIPVDRAGDGSADVSILAIDDATGALLPGACFQLRGYSNVGCDVNRDGHVDFADIPFGEYVIDLIRAPAGMDLADPGWPDRLHVNSGVAHPVERAVYFTAT